MHSLPYLMAWLSRIHRDVTRFPMAISGSHGGGGCGGPSRSTHNYREDDDETNYVEVGDQTNSVAFGVVLNHWTVVGNSSDCIYCIESCITNCVERKHMHIYYQSSHNNQSRTFSTISASPKSTISGRP